jgi:hypothetical protein
MGVVPSPFPSRRQLQEVTKNIGERILPHRFRMVGSGGREVLEIEHIAYAGHRRWFLRNVRLGFIDGPDLGQIGPDKVDGRWLG